MGDKGKIGQRKKKEVSLLGIFGKELLDDLLKKLTEATDFSFSIIDYKGQTVTDSIIRNEFCNSKKRDERACLECNVSAAFAAAKAAIKCCPYVFYCPVGFVRIAVPIIVNDQYLGAIIGGRVRCSDADGVDGFGLVHETGEIESFRKDDLYQNVPDISYQRITAIADLMFLLLKEMGEKETYGLLLASYEHNEAHLKDIRRRNAVLKNDLREKELEHLKAKLLPQFLLNLLVTVSNFSILENAAQTESVIADVASVLRYYTDDSQDQISIGEEMAQIERYLKTLKKQYENRLNYRMKYQEEDAKQMIPILSIFPFVGYIINFGVIPNYFKGTIYVDLEILGDRCIITIQLEHSEYLLNNSRNSKRFDTIMDESTILEQIENTKKRLYYAFGDECKISMQPNMVVIDLPKVTKNNEVKN